MKVRKTMCLLTLGCFVALSASAADWPMWRFDAKRSGCSPTDLPRGLRLQWVYQFPLPIPAWPDEEQQQIDPSYEPVVMGNTLFVPSMVRDCVTALDVDTAKVKWRFYTDGPVRYAPIAWKDKIYVGSDDGYLYCLKAETGALIWRFRGGPSNRKVIGHERLISCWPVSGGPVLLNGNIYFAAGLWPFEGIFIHALDAETGKALWVNDNSDTVYIAQPHGTKGFAGLAPQGYLVASGNRLIVPNGRAVPAGLDRTTGKLLYYRTGIYDTKNQNPANTFVSAYTNFFS